MVVSDSARRQRRLILLIVASVAVGLATYWLRASPEVPTNVEPMNVAVEVPPPHVEKVAPIEPEADVLDEAPGPPPLDHPALRRFAALNRYSDSARRIDENSVDLLEPNARYEAWQPLSGRGPDAPVFSVLFTADRYALRGDETALIRVSLQRNGVEVPFRRLTLRAAPVRPAVDEVDPEPVKLATSRDGSTRTAELEPDVLWPDHIGRVEATVSFTADGLAEQTGTLAFQVTPTRWIPARFDGRFADRVHDGDLVVEIGLEVKTAGIYRIEGNLYDGYGDPVAWARHQGMLEPGQRSAPIAFDGLILRDVGARGPYTLRQLRGYRMRPGDVPHREDLRDWPSPHALEGRYVLSDFRDEPRVSPRDERMAERMRDALGRGVRLGQPSSLATESIR